MKAGEKAKPLGHFQNHSANNLPAIPLLNPPPGDLPASLCSVSLSLQAGKFTHCSAANQPFHPVAAAVAYPHNVHSRGMVAQAEAVKRLWWQT